MIPVLTASQMRAVDKRLIEEVGIPSLVLMENAASGVLEAMSDWLIDDDLSIVIFCGTGNNGGDGLALARMLIMQGQKNVVVSIVGDEEKLSSDAAVQLKALREVKPGIRTSFPPLPTSEPEIIVDAMLGTGTHGEPRDNIRKSISLINALADRYQSKVLSIDIPSGLNPDEPSEPDQEFIIRATRIVTIGASKLGFHQGAARQYVGDLRIGTLGEPVSIEHFPKNEQVYLVTEPDVIRAYPHRSETGSKFDFGRVLALCGSRGMTGAAIMAASAALRAGCGLVNVALPDSERSLVAQAMPELLTVGCPENPDGGPTIEAWEMLQEHIDRTEVLLVGCGLRPWKGTTELILRMLEEIDKPIIADAGALGALVGKLDILKRRKSPTILTPHSGELARMVERPWQEVEKDRLNVARRFAQEHEVTVVMKGAPTYTISPEGTVHINKTGNAGLATAGAGDVLAGILAGTFVQMREKPVEASYISVYFHGLAADLAATDLTRIALTATDVTRYLPMAFKQVGLT
jgi:ADP-dependent NAD(P)H-hydrate dehydratase / NAD(P)H-hydrate epimerase